MSWNEKMKDWGGANLSFLSEDGEVLSFLVIGDPELIEGKYKGKPTQRIAAPVITQDGFTLLIIGKRLARRLSKHEDNFDHTVFEVTRHGEEGDSDTRYVLKVCPDKDLTEELLKLAEEGDFDDDIEEALIEARQIANQ